MANWPETDEQNQELRCETLRLTRRSLAQKLSEMFPGQSGDVLDLMVLLEDFILAIVARKDD